MSNYIPADTVIISNTTFKNNTDIVNVDLQNTPFVDNSMYEAFRNCSNLQTVTNINQNVTTMRTTFWYCTNLVNAPTIPNSVTNMYGTFRSCSSLVNAPVIPNSVTNMYITFWSCMSLTGNVNIYSNQITNAAGCFAFTSGTKNVYIPFKYENGEYTKTYNTFIAEGYSTTTRANGALLFDTGTH